MGGNTHRNTQKISIFPSIVGSGGDDIIKIAGLKTPETEKETVTIDDMKLLVGESAIKYAHRIYPAREKNWIESIAFRALLTHALRLAGLEPGYSSWGRDITIVTGLPVSHYRSCKDRLVELIKETARMDVDVRVILQPLGTLFDQLLNDDMSVRDVDLLERNVGIIDIGYYTTDIVVVHGLELVKKQLSSLEGGISSAYTAIAEEIYDTFDLKKEESEIGDVIRDGYVRVFGQKKDVRPIIERCLRTLAIEIGTHVRLIWKEGVHIDRVLISGGGAEVLRGYLNNLYQHNEFVTGSQLANARGYVKFGRRLLYGRAG